MNSQRNIVLIKPLMIITISILVVSCMVPLSKEAYLKNFDRFVERVKMHHKEYNKKDWRYADSLFDKFSNDWYFDFEDELSAQEKLQVVKLKLQYRTFREPDVVNDFFKNFKDEDAAEIKEKFDEYLEEDFDEDMEQIIEGMKEIGDSAVKVFEDLIEKIDNRF